MGRKQQNQHRTWNKTNGINDKDTLRLNVYDYVLHRMEISCT